MRMAISSICDSAILSGWPRPASAGMSRANSHSPKTRFRWATRFRFTTRCKSIRAARRSAAHLTGTGLTQSFSSIRYQPIHLLTFDLNHNYLRNLPTFDPALISTGLLDQYLFQGLSGGVRVELPYRIAVSTDIGRSKSSTDTSTSWNQMYGLTFGEIKNTGLADGPAVREIQQLVRRRGSTNLFPFRGASPSASTFKLQAGTQHLNSAFSTNSNSKFVTSIVDWSIGPRYFFEGLYSWNTGTSMNYQQTNFTFGYRFGGKFRK